MTFNRAAKCLTPLLPVNPKTNLRSHNSLRDDRAPLPTLEEPHRGALHLMLQRHNAQDVFCLHILHRHIHLEEGHHFVGHLEPLQEWDYRWTRSVSNEALDPSNIHGHIFQVTPDGLQAYEYQVGPMPDMSQVDDAFFSEFSSYLLKHRLESIVGLEVLIPQYKDQRVAELILSGHQTLMVDLALLSKGDSSTITAWISNRESNELTVGEVHVTERDGTHKTFNAGAPWPDLESIVNELQQAGIIKPKG